VLTTTITLGDDKNIAVKILADQIAHLEAGEVRTFLERTHSAEDVWTAAQFAEQFAVVYFDPPVVHVIRRRDKKRGHVYYTHKPQFYFSFTAESEP
jgi:16S rRNA G966 N2-methylase RsmD